MIKTMEATLKEQATKWTLEFIRDIDSHSTQDSKLHEQDDMTLLAMVKVLMERACCET